MNGEQSLDSHSDESFEVLGKESDNSQSTLDSASFISSAIQNIQQKIPSQSYNESSGINMAVSNFIKF